MDDHTYVVNVEAAVVRDGDYLLVRRSPAEEHAAGRLAFPGGKVAQSPPGDDPIEATARREVAEEVGVVVGAVEYAHSRTFETDHGVPVVNVVTRCAYEAGEARPLAPEEVSSVRWLAPDEVADLPDAPAYLQEDVERIEASRPL